MPLSLSFFHWISACICLFICRTLVSFLPTKLCFSYSKELIKIFFLEIACQFVCLSSRLQCFCLLLSTYLTYFILSIISHVFYLYFNIVYINVDYVIPLFHILPCTIFNLFLQWPDHEAWKIFWWFA